MTDLGQHMEAVARRLLGEPNRKLSTPTQWRYGAHGSLAIEVAGDKAGTWYDHEAGVGGGVIDLIVRQRGGTTAAAAGWLESELGAHKPNGGGGERRIVATYDYRDEAGTMLFQVVRFEPKDFRQRRPDGNGGWRWSLGSTRQVPYRLPELLDRPEDAVVFAVEGEKDADRLAALGLTATCNPGGAGKWRPEFAEHLRGARVYVIPDADDAGRRHARQVATSLRGIAAEVRVVHLPGLGDKKDVSDWLDRGGTADQLLALCAGPAAAEGVDGGADRQRGAARPYVAFRDIRPVIAGQWRIKHVLPQAGLAILYGPPGQGKTFVVIDLCMQIALGRAWRGHRTFQTGVLYLAPDGGALVANRLEAYRRFHGVDEAAFFLDNAPLDLLGRGGGGDVERVIATIAAIEAAHRLTIGVIVVDTASASTPGGDENSSQDMTAFIANLARLRDGKERLTLVLHHTPKSDATALRGHSSVVGQPDTHLLVNERVITVKKQRDGPDGATYPFDLAVVELGKDEDGDAVTSCVAVAGAGAASRSANLPPANLRAALQGDHRLQAEAAAQHLQAHQTGHFGMSGRPLARVRLRRRDHRDHKPDTKQKAFKRAASSLQAAGLIGVWDDWVWLTGQTGQ